MWAEIFSGKYIYLFADTPCDLPQIENGNLAQYYYSFKSYYFPMHKGKKLSYSCMVGYTTETGTQDGRITCTAKGWSPVPRCYSELTLFISSLLPAGTFPSWFCWDIQAKKLHKRRDKMYRVQSVLCIETTQVYISGVFLQ